MRQENNGDSQSKIIKNIEKFTSNRNQITHGKRGSERRKNDFVIKMTKTKHKMVESIELDTSQMTRNVMGRKIIKELVTIQEPMKKNTTNRHFSSLFHINSKMS